MPIQTSGSGRVTLSFWPLSPSAGDNLTLEAKISTPVSNSGPDDESVTLSWQIDGNIKGSGTETARMGPGENYQGNTKKATGAYTGPFTASASFALTDDRTGTVLMSGSTSTSVP